MSEIKSAKQLDSQDFEYLKELLYLQGDIEYGFYNLHLEWQSKDNTTSEERWRISRIVTDEVGHGLNITRLLKQFQASETIEKLVNKQIGKSEFPIFNTNLSKYDEIICFPIFYSRVDQYNLECLKASNFTPLAKISETILNEQQLHYEFARNSIIEVIEHQETRKLGSPSGVQEAINRFYQDALSLYHYGGKLTTTPSDNLALLFPEQDEIKERYISDVAKLLEGFDFTLPDL